MSNGRPVYKRIDSSSGIFLHFRYARASASSLVICLYVMTFNLYSKCLHHIHPTLHPIAHYYSSLLPHTSTLNYIHCITISHTKFLVPKPHRTYSTPSYSLPHHILSTPRYTLYLTTYSLPCHTLLTPPHTLYHITPSTPPPTLYPITHPLPHHTLSTPLYTLYLTTHSLPHHTPSTPPSTIHP